MEKGSIIQSSHVELNGARAGEPQPRVNPMEADAVKPGLSATKLAKSLTWLPGQAIRPFRNRCRILSASFARLLPALQSHSFKTVSEDFRTLTQSVLLLESELQDACETFKLPHKFPQVRVPGGAVLPTIAALAEGFLATTGYRFEAAEFSEYVQSFQETGVLKMAELWAIIPVLKLILLEKIALCGGRLLEDPTGSCDLQTLLGSLGEVKRANWKAVIEPLIRFDRILREDPAGAYSRMDFDSREMYRNKLVHIADHSDCTEMEVAREALNLARQAQKQSRNAPRAALRASHVGTYLLAEGEALLRHRVEFRPTGGDRVRDFLRSHPDEFYLPGIAVLTLAIVLAVVLLLTNPSTSLGLILLSTLAVLLPSSQSAVQIVNNLVTLLLPAQIIPKLDFSEGLPADCVTLVAIPTLLLNEQQVRQLADDLEVRFLGNQDPHLHFMLLTDLPDSAEKPPETSPLVHLCAELVNQLNEKYRAKAMGSFFMMHRHPLYNPREGLWMGWERKRGKLMDLNNLLRGTFDSFPVKVGNLDLLSSFRFVITLDSDTELPRGSARRMVGALAHPLNQAILDPHRKVVVTGYGILQPRVGVSVQSSARSRLASIYSGQTGLDIYSRAASDVYQDLYGEGIFVGKGIYEVDTLHRVLDRRFPRNALLSHDLVEGAYARAGLVSDVEVIEDYPSHYSAHNRRKHRWVRGDWQIAEWVRPLVPEESGEKVPNPLSVVSRWKILDNLRRSMVEPAFFLLLLMGWLCLPGGPGRWTLASIAILFLPALCQLAVGLGNAAAQGKRAIALDAVNNFLNESVADWLTVTFLAHQALLSMDAMVRTLVRRVITRQRLLQWETAAQAELAGYKRTILDLYLNWTPSLALGLLALLYYFRRPAVAAALPILILWGFSKPISLWLDRPPRAPRRQASQADRWLLRMSALRTWRYFAEFSTEEHHWLIPDNVQERPAKIAARVSPTNIGFLLNARQVACEFGYLTVPEFVQQTLQTLATVTQLPSHRGHLFNWYDTQTLEPLPPAFVSTVDSGNLIASLWTLHEGCVELLGRSLLQSQLQEGFLDYLYVLRRARALSRRKFSAIRKDLRRQGWLPYLLDVPDAALKDIQQSTFRPKYADAVWFREQAKERISHVSRCAQTYAPWLLPEFAALSDDPVIRLQVRIEDMPVLKRMPEFIDSLGIRLKAAADSAPAAEQAAIYAQLLALLPDARSHVLRLIEDLKKISAQAGKLADEMDFGFLQNESRGVLSIGYDFVNQRLHSACYDLLASEARVAFFAAIAKDHIPQESWFQLGRVPTFDQGRPGLLSWTGTMFEYLMPSLWMRIYPNTLLERAGVAAVRSQRAYAARQGIPWGISEAAYSKMDELGNYQYRAFGVPQLAIHKGDQEGPVVSPYSSFLALAVDSSAALRNLRRLQGRGVFGTYGFFESLDFNPARAHSGLQTSKVVRCWMAHHQGMSLLAIGNYLHHDVVQRWFHSHPRVQATELLLQEKPAGRVRAPRARPNAA